MIGDILLIRNGGCVFKRLRDMLNSEFDHVAICISDDKIIEAIPTEGVVIKPLSKYDSLTKRVARIKQQAYVPAMITYCLSKLGTKYDFVQALSVYTMIALRIKKTLDPIEVKNAFICTELVGQAAQFAGFKFVDNASVDRLVPEDIYKSDKVILL